MNSNQALLEVKDLKKHYTLKRAFGKSQLVKALDGVSFSVPQNQTLGIVGESGCGKSTLAKTLMRLEPATDGSVVIDKQDAQNFSRLEYRTLLQMIFQDPYSSLNPRKKAWQIIAEPLMIQRELSKQQCYDRAVSLMQQVGLRPELANRYPHMFSGGQRQRLGIARALSLNPKIMICDEPVSALDVSIQAQVLNLLMQLQDELKLTYLFISHDLNVVKHISHQILVMYLGKIVEYGPREQVFENPLHPYTKVLLASSPKLDAKKQERITVQGELPSPLNPPSGCAFHKRCPLATEQCRQETPVLKQVQGRQVACFEVKA